MLILKHIKDILTKHKQTANTNVRSVYITHLSNFLKKNMDICSGYFQKVHKKFMMVPVRKEGCKFVYATVCV